MRYVFALIDGKYVVLDRQAVDSQGYPLGCAVVDLGEIKKLYPHLTIDVQLLKEDKPVVSTSLICFNNRHNVRSETLWCVVMTKMFPKMS